jgi:hypothetical protein
LQRESHAQEPCCATPTDSILSVAFFGAFCWLSEFH